MRANLILTALLCSATVLSNAQNANPFELLWRVDGKVEVSPVSASPLAVVPAPPRPVETPVVSIAETTSVDASNPSPMEIIPDTAVTLIPFIPEDTITVAEATPIDSQVIAESQGDTASTESVIQKPQTQVPVIQRATDEALKVTPLALVLIFGLVFSLLAWVLSLNRDILRNVYRAALNENFSALLFREQRFATTQYLYYIIYFVFFVTGGLFLYLISREFGWTAWVFKSVWSSIGLVSVVYLLRHLTMNILGSAYPVTKEATHFSFSILLHNILLGIALIPVTLFLAFGPDSLDKPVAIAGIALCGLVYLIRQFRGLVIGGSYLGSNPLHFFIYLCAVEILPMFTLVKFFHH